MLDKEKNKEYVACRIEHTWRGPGYDHPESYIECLFEHQKDEYTAILSGAKDARKSLFSKGMPTDVVSHYLECYSKNNTWTGGFTRITPMTSEEVKIIETKNRFQSERLELEEKLKERGSKHVLKGIGDNSNVPEITLSWKYKKPKQYWRFTVTDQNGDKTKVLLGKTGSADFAQRRNDRLSAGYWLRDFIENKELEELREMGFRLSSEVSKYAFFLCEGQGYI